MTKNQTSHSFPEAALLLSTQQDVHALTRCFADCLENLFAPDQVNIYTVHWEGTRYDRANLSADKLTLSDALQETDASRHPASTVTGAVAGLTSDELVEQTSDEGETVFLLRVDYNLGPAALVRLHGLQGSPEIRRTFTQLTRLFGNIYTLLARASQDGLTGLLNRRSLQERLARLLQALPDQPRRSEDGSTDKHHYLALMDIDRFKRVNDEFGHVFGDEVLLLFTKLAETIFRHSDQLFRYGGEEFAVVLENCAEDHVNHVLERFRLAVFNFDFPQVGQVTVSMGACRLSADEPMGNIIDRADRALYFAKNNGRNQCHRYEDLINANLITPPGPTETDIELF